MKIKVHETGYAALVNHYRWLSVNIATGNLVKFGLPMDRQYGMKGSKGIIKKIYYNRFWRYEHCYVSVFFPNFDKTIWIDADSLEFQN